MPTKPGGQTIAFTSIRVIAADGEIGRTSFERCFPALAQIPLALSSRVIEQSDIGVSDLAVELGVKLWEERWITRPWSAIACLTTRSACAR